MYAEFQDASGQPQQRVLKLLSEDPGNYPDAPREGIRRILETETGVPHHRGQPVDTSRIASIRMGTTVRLLDEAINRVRVSQPADQVALCSLFLFWR